MDYNALPTAVLGQLLTVRGLPVPPRKQQRVTALLADDQAVLAAAVLAAQPHPIQPVALAPIPPPRYKLELDKQHSTESLTQFLRRVDIFFQSANVPPADYINLLLNSATLSVKNFISDCLQLNPAENYNNICLKLHEHFGLSPYQLAHNFRSIRPHKDERIKQFGHRLLFAYLDFCRLPVNQLQPIQAFLQPALVEQLLVCVNGGIRTAIMTRLAENPDLTWDAILTIADGQRDAQLANPRSNHQTDRTPMDKHSKAALLPTPTGAICFSCHQPGHLAPQCPRRSGNAPGSV